MIENTSTFEIIKLIVNIISFIPYILIFLSFILGRNEKTFVTKLNLQLTIMATIRTITCIIYVKDSIPICKLQALFTIFPDFAIQFMLTFISYIANIFMLYQEMFQQKKAKFLTILLLMGYIIPLGLGLLFTFLDSQMSPDTAEGFFWITDKKIMYPYLICYFSIVVFNLLYLIKNIRNVSDFAVKNNIDCSKFWNKLYWYLLSSIFLLSIEIFGIIIFFLEQTEIEETYTKTLEQIEVMLESSYLPIVTSIYSFNFQIREDLKQIICRKKDAIETLVFDDDDNSTDNRKSTINEFRKSYL